MQKKHYVLLGLILVLAAFFRFYMIKTLPGGLFPDEAANGLDINNIFKGHIQPFFARGNGREALFFYLLAGAVKLWGRGYWQHHIVSAAIGTLSVFTVYLMAKRLYNYRVALLSAFLMAANAWAIVLSRTAFRAILMPLFISLTTYFLVRAVQARTKKDLYWSAVLAGAALAGGFYTYIAYRIIIGIFGFIAVFLLIADSKQNFKWAKQFCKPALAAIAAFIVVFAPLGVYFAKNPSAFVGRAGEVSILNPDLNHGHLLATFGDVFFKSVRAYFIDGDLNWRQNISGQPFLSPLVSPFFGFTLLVLSLATVKFLWQALKNKQDNSRLKNVVVIGLFWGMLVPVVATAEGIPHGLRSIGTQPAVFILSAVGMLWFVRKVLEIWHYPWMEKIYWAVAIFYFATLIIVPYNQYFVYAANSSENYYAYRSDLSTVSGYLNQNNDRWHTYLVLDLFSMQTVDYLTTATNNPYIIVDPANSYKLRLSKGDKVVFAQSTLFDVKKFMQTHPSAKIISYVNNNLGDTDMIVFQIAKSDPGKSLSFNADKSFWAVNYGDRIDWSWQNQSFDPWEIKIWQCSDPECKSEKLIKDDRQNDYLANTDHAEMDSKKDLYFQAIGYAKGRAIKNFGIIKIPRYK